MSVSPIHASFNCLSHLIICHFYGSYYALVSNGNKLLSIADVSVYDPYNSVDMTIIRYRLIFDVIVMYVSFQIVRTSDN